MYLVFLLFAAAVCLPATPADNLLLMTRSEAEGLKRHAQELRAAADKALRAGPWSVVFHRPEGYRLGPHDFFSEGPYWWPDPKNPNGPYVRRDGETNPDRFVENDRDMNDMAEAVTILGAAAYATGDPRYTRRALDVLRVWFIDEKTRMAPHMKYGQGIRGRTDGRAAGLIETRPFIWLIQGVHLAELAPGWDPAVGKALREWFAEYQRWFTTDEKGLQEAKAGNNHATWWAAQVASFAVFTGDNAQQERIWQSYREYLLPSQFEPEGNAPREDSRTKSLSYSAMNLDAFTIICRMAEIQGVDLWSYRTPKGISIRTAIDYLVPYVQNPSAWNKPQITSYDATRNYFLALAGLGFRNHEYIKMQQRIGLSGGAAAKILNAVISSQPARRQEP